VYRKLAARHGLKVESILLENRFETDTPRGLETLAKRLLSRIHRTAPGPGASVLALFRVP